MHANATADQYAGYYKEQRRNRAWTAKFREYLEAAANGENDDWLRYIGPEEAKLIAIASRDPNPAEAKRKTDEVLCVVWERGASAAADTYCEQQYGW